MTKRSKLLTNNFTIFFVLIILGLCNLASASNNSAEDLLEYDDNSSEDSVSDIVGNFRKKYIYDLLFDKTKDSGYFETNECLISNKSAKEILTKMGTPNKEIDENLRFALGPCNPVIMIPGLYGTRLVLSIDCEKFSEKTENMINLRLFCGFSMCKKKQGIEEHVLWPALFDSPFELFINSDNSYSSCFGHFFNYFRESECPTQPKNDRKEKFFEEAELESICWNDEAVKITFYGGTKKTQSSSQCGLGAIKNILSVGSQYIPEYWINMGATKGFTDMYNRYYQIGYRSGFSMAGVPYDFRRFVSTNDMFKDVLTYQIQKLYENTGKPVIIIGHSFGTINTLNYLLSKNFSMGDKIKKFIAVGPPFAGASKDIGYFVEGTDEFAQTFTFRGRELMTLGLDRFGQQLLIPFMASGFELRPNPIMHKLSFDIKYKEFIQAVQERIILEQICKNTDCPASYIEENTKMFNKYFDFFPKFTDKECQVEKILAHVHFLELIEEYDFYRQKNFPHVLPCRLGIYDVLNCPLVKFKQNKTEDYSVLENNCKYNKDRNSKEYYNYDCKKDKRCIDTFFHENFPYPYDSVKMKYLFDRFNNKFSKEFPNVKLNMTKYFDSREKLQNKVEKMIHYQSEISNLKDMTIPSVDTMIIFGNHEPSVTAYLYERNENERKITKDDNKDVLMKNGDGTVPTWTSVLPGLKWLYDKKVDNLPQKIQMVEYCSLLGNPGSKYAYDPNHPDREFMGISCDCIAGDTFFFDYKTTSSNLCGHATMHSDQNLIRFIEKYIFDKANEVGDVDLMSEQRKFAVNKHSAKRDYEMQCNVALRKLSDKDTNMKMK